MKRKYDFRKSISYIWNLWSSSSLCYITRRCYEIPIETRTMSLDARYILQYDTQAYIPPTPMDKDKNFLESEYGGECVQIGSEFTVFWDKPKYTLLPEDVEKLMADQVLELLDGGIWKRVDKNGK